MIWIFPETKFSNEEEKLKVGPNGEKRKQITMLLSDPETDEYIQQKLDLPVMRFQVQSNVAFDAISTEWTKVRILRTFIDIFKRWT